MLPNNDLVKDPRRLQFFLLADVIFVILLISIIIRQIVLILVRRRKSYDESRLYIKFVNLFAAMALGPAIGLVIITSLFFNLELRTWYGDAVRDAVVNSNIVARNYENEIQAEIVSDTQLIMREILKVYQNNEVNIQSIRTALSEFINLRTISSIYIFNTEGNIYLSLKDPDNKNFSVPSNEIFKIVNQNRVYIFQLNKNSITAYKKINFLNDVYMQVNRNLNTNIWDHISATKEAFEIYTMKEEESSGIQITYSMIFVLFSICFILVAILIGFNLASNLSKPITNLIKSANKISEGNFDAKVSEADQFQEIKVLLSSYNKMISEIENKQNELISKSQEDEEKRIFIESILSLLTIVVISLDKNFNILLYNKTLTKLFRSTKSFKINENFLSYFPEWKKIFENFNLSLGSGKIILLKGKNGSGKTTLLKALLNLIEPSSGAIYWKGKLLKKNLYNFFNHVTYIADRTSSLSKLSVQENIKIWRKIFLSNISNSQVENILKTLKLNIYLDQKVNSLSFGETKKLEFLRLIIENKKIWILDEPLSNLDDESIDVIAQTFEDHRSKEGSIIFSSHQESEINVSEEVLL